MADFSPGQNRNRIQVIIMIAVLTLVGFMVVVKIFKPSQAVQGAVQLNSGPALETTPGSEEASKKYKELVQQQNTQNVEKALQTGVSAVPTIVGKKSNKDFFQDPAKIDCSTTSPYAGMSVYDLNSKQIGVADSAAKAWDNSNQLIGYVDPDGTVRDASGKIIGHVARKVAPGTPVYDANGKLIGTVGADGKVRDANGNIIGEVGPDGIVRDLNGKVIGTAGGPVPAATPVYDENGNLIGMVGPDGLVRDANGKVIGRVTADGKVVDATGKVIGRVGDKKNANGQAGSASASGTAGTAGAAGTSGTDAQTRKIPPAVVGKVVYDANGNPIGTVGPDGLVRDANGRVIGVLGEDGMVRDMNGRLLGSLDDPTAMVASTGNPATDLRLANARLTQLNQLQQSESQRQQDMMNARQLEQMMANQANQLFAAWSVPVNQNMVQSPQQEGKNAGVGTGDGGNNPAANGQAAQNVGAVMIKTGSIMYAVLDTAINTDEPGPIMATIVSGPLQGTRLIGQVTTSGLDANKALLSFSTMNMPSFERSIAVNAVAIDPNTSRTAFASYTDRHLLYRYGTVFASSFMSGFGQAVAQSGATLTQNLTTGNSLLANPSLSTIDKMFVALGQVGQQLSAQFSKGINRPPTIYVKSGIGMGILFLTDVNSPAG